MTKPLRIAIMTRSRLENKYLKTKLFLIRICLKDKETIVIGYTREKGKDSIKILT